jgi:DcaP outer membrane protein
MKIISPLSFVSLVAALLTLPLSRGRLLAQTAAPTSPPSIEERLKRLEEQQEFMLKALKAKDAEIADLERRLQQQPSPPGSPVLTASTSTQPPAAVASPAAVSTEPTTQGTPSLADLSEEKTAILNRESFSGDERSVPRSGNAPIDPEYKGFTPLFGTDTWIRLGGYAKLDSIVDSTKVGNPNMFVTSKIPVEGEADYGRGGGFAMEAKQTRINVELRRPTVVGSLRIFYENDFFNNNTLPTMDYRLRHFYGQVANITIGQTWTTFYDPDVSPETLDFEGPGSLSVLRQPQFRYTFPLIKDQMHLAIAAEQPNVDLTGPTIGSGVGKNMTPDLAAHWRWEGQPGHLQIGGILRSLAYENNPGPCEKALGWGLNLSGAWHTFGKDSLLATATYGDGIGRYLQDLPGGSAAVVASDGHLATLTAFGGYLGYQHYWSDHWRSTVTWSYVQLDNRAEQGNSAFDQTHYFSANLVWAPTPSVSMGLEYLYGFKEERSGREGDDDRVEFSIKYNLVR